MILVRVGSSANRSGASQPPTQHLQGPALPLNTSRAPPPAGPRLPRGRGLRAGWGAGNLAPASPPAPRGRLLPRWRRACRPAPADPVGQPQVSRQDAARGRSPAAGGLD